MKPVEREARASVEKTGDPWTDQHTINVRTINYQIAITLDDHAGLAAVAEHLPLIMARIEHAIRGGKP